MSKVYSLTRPPYVTIQGEGSHVGTVAVFVRFTGCSHQCHMCDEDFDNAGWTGTIEDLVDAITQTRIPYVVFTGGEPALQLDRALVAMLQSLGAKCAIETNGCFDVSHLGLDWITVSPKNRDGGPVSADEWVQRTGDDLKVLYPDALSHEAFFGTSDFANYLISPIMGGCDQDANIRAAVDYVKTNPTWKLSVQQHVLIGIP